jgi:alkaline phosphatase D
MDLHRKFMCPAVGVVLSTAGFPFRAAHSIGVSSMQLSRRQILRLAAALGLIELTGCGDDDSADAPTPTSSPSQVPTASASATATATATETAVPSATRTETAAPTETATPEGDGLPVYEYDGEPGPETLFQHGVASGDPLADRVILWTRVTPATAAVLEVFWEIAEDAEFSHRLNAGWTETSGERDYTVKIDADRLAAGTTYYYRFRALGRTSLLGRTRTAPSGSPERLRLAVVSCSNYSAGYFHAYRRIAERLDLDAVVHLGDYIYEYGDFEYGASRFLDPPHEILTLSDYRRRYAHYRTDPDLQAVHQQHPFIVVWDDHESANNSWRDGAENHDSATEGPWSVRRAVAEQAYAEWMPIRSLADGRIWRSLRFGDLVDLIMLDTRLWGRDLQVDGAGIFDPDRTLLGDDQEAWLLEQLHGSTARWKVLGQQVMVGAWKLLGLPNALGGGNVANTDQWDGYQAARQRLYDALRNDAIDNVVVLTGDVHSSWAHDLNDDPNNPESYDPATGDGSLAVEFVTPGVTSPGIPGGNEQFTPIFLSQNPGIKFGDWEHRGYIVLDVTAERAQAAWFHFDQVEQPEATESFARAFAVYDGENRLTEESAPAPAPLRVAQPAPARRAAA